MAALKQIRSLGLFTRSQGAFFTASRQRFQTQRDLWKQQLPDITPYYAVKCNPDPRLIGWHKEGGGAFDCASAREIELVCGNKKADESILFANPCKTAQDIQVARQKGVQWVTADSVEELQKMYLSIYRPSVLLRVEVDDSASTCPFSSKFGLPLADLGSLIEEARNRAFSVDGVSFHVGSGNKSPHAFGYAIHDIMKYWYQTQTERMYTLDIGGGWSPSHTLFRQQASSVRDALRDIPSPVQVIAEPGRFFASTVYDLYVRVIGKKPARTGRGFRYTLDESLYGQFSCVPFDHATPPMYRIRDPYNDPMRRRVPATFFGRTCDSLDVIAKSDDTEELFVGDWLYVPSMGAYTVATSTEFNGFPKPDIVETDDQPENESLIACLGLTYPFVNALSV